MRAFDHHRFQPWQARNQMHFLAVAAGRLPDVLTPDGRSRQV
jgi:hypothetical protein